MYLRMIFFTLAVASSGQTGVANSFNFIQSDKSGGREAHVENMEIVQSGTAVKPDSKNEINAFIEGSIKSITIKQINASQPNIANISFYGSDTAENNLLTATYDGSRNTHDLSIGYNGDSSSSNFYSEVDYSINVVGDGNQINDLLENSSIHQAKLWYNGAILGSENKINIRSMGSGIDSLQLGYMVNGDDNNVDITMDGSGVNNVNVALAGENYAGASKNDWVLQSGSSTLSVIGVKQSGPYSHDVSGSVSLLGNNNQMHLDLYKSGAGDFDVSLVSDSLGTYADLDVTAGGNGSLNLNQSTPGAYIEAEISIPDGSSLNLEQSREGAHYVGSIVVPEGKTLTITQ